MLSKQQYRQRHPFIRVQVRMQTISQIIALNRHNFLAIPRGSTTWMGEASLLILLKSYHLEGVAVNTVSLMWLFNVTHYIYESFCGIIVMVQKMKNATKWPQFCRATFLSEQERLQAYFLGLTQIIVYR